MAVITTTLLLATWFTPTEDVSLVGNIKFYNKGVMETVALNRGYITDTALYDSWLRLNNLDGAVSLMRRGDLGRRLILVVPGLGRFRVMSIDCVAKKHYLRRLEQGDIIEVDWGLAQRMNMTGVLKGKILFEGRRQWQVN